MDYDKIVKNEKQFQSLTTLKPVEFRFLLKAFAPRWEQFYRHHTLEGKPRLSPLYREHGNAKLKGTAQKLFFLLVYLKTNSLQEQQAASFGISQAKVSKISRVLLNVLNDALKDLRVAPIEDGAQLRNRLHDHPDKRFSYDGTDRPVPRSRDNLAQQHNYSGKHHCHTVKNLTLCDDRQYVHYLSPVYVGSEHDKSIADDCPIELPAGSVLRQDLGFLGLTLEGVLVEIPYKKPKRGTLTFAQKLYNKMLSGTRVVVEHANSGIKRLGMVRQTIRLHSITIREIVMRVACGLHNMRVLSTYRAYQK